MHLYYGAFDKYQWVLHCQNRVAAAKDQTGVGERIIFKTTIRITWKPCKNAFTESLSNLRILKQSVLLIWKFSVWCSFSFKLLKKWKVTFTIYSTRDYSAWCSLFDWWLLICCGTTWNKRRNSGLHDAENNESMWSFYSTGVILVFSHCEYIYKLKIIFHFHGQTKQAPSHTSSSTSISMKNSSIAPNMGLEY